MAKDAYTQAQHVQRRNYRNRIEVVKKKNETTIDKFKMMNATFEEDAKWKVHALHVQVIGPAEKLSPQENAKNFGTKIGISDIPFVVVWQSEKR